MLDAMSPFHTRHSLGSNEPLLSSANIKNFNELCNDLVLLAFILTAMLVLREVVSLLSPSSFALLSIARQSQGALPTIFLNETAQTSALYLTTAISLYILDHENGDIIAHIVHTI